METVTRNLKHAADNTCGICGGQLAYLTSLNRTERTIVACSICHHPAGDNHPLQKEMDAIRLRRDQQEEEQRKHQAPPGLDAALMYSQSAVTTNEKLERMERLLTEQGRRIAALEQGRNRKG